MKTRKLGGDAIGDVESAIVKGLQVRQEVSADDFSPRTNQNMSDLKSTIRALYPDEITLAETPLETAIRIIKASKQGWDPTVADAPAPSPDFDNGGARVTYETLDQLMGAQQASNIDTVIVEREELEDDLDHTIHHLEVASAEMGPVVKAEFLDAVETLSKKIAKVVLSYTELSGPVRYDPNYVAAVRLGAIFTALQHITTLLCAGVVGGDQGATARELVLSALAGE
jgi:hypothetical protein